jgi:aerobic-type carbon monoxide dehydrogenase small subunit (CoxS/CutS family)
MANSISVTVNGVKRQVATDGERPLLEVLREEWGMRGVHFGCGEGECGACSVLVDGKRVFSCLTPVSDVEGKSVVTVEGLAKGEVLHPVQEAFLKEGAYQCGYCTSGMMIAAVALLREKANPSETEIREGMNNNLCRCCGYSKIVKAVQTAAANGGGKI